MKALRRVLGAPGLWIGLAAAQLLLASAVALPVTVMVGAAMGPFSIEAPQLLLPPIAELMIDNPSLLVALAAALATSALLSGLLWILLGAGIIRRLHRPASASETIAAAVRHLPGMAALSAYHGLLRGLLVIFAAANNELIRGVVLVLGWTLCTAAIDLARSEVVVAGAKGYHPKTVLRAIGRVFSRPKLWLGSALLTLTGLAISVAILAIAVHSFGDAGVAIYGARALAALGVGVALWRVAIAVGAAEEQTEPSAEG